MCRKHSVHDPFFAAKSNVDHKLTIGCVRELLFSTVTRIQLRVTAIEKEVFDEKYF
ncbi:hypothetical protein TUM20903_33020 [Citrobacter koseri]|nr:hypothetical protein TUM20903_33020 [Citrobacter koseri]